jgi:REP element-mobilizing transposase RayT
VSEYIHKSHNVTVLLYHIVFPAKYRRAVIDAEVDVKIRDVCLEIEKRYEMKFLEIGTDRDHVHFLVQSVPTYSVTKLVRMIKSLTAREVFRECPQVKKQLWGGEFWSDGYFASTVGKHGDEGTIAAYVKRQGGDYEQLYRDGQLELF